MIQSSGRDRRQTGEDCLQPRVVRGSGGWGCLVLGRSRHLDGFLAGHELARDFVRGLPRLMEETFLLHGLLECGVDALEHRFVLCTLELDVELRASPSTALGAADLCRELVFEAVDPLGELVMAADPLEGYTAVDLRPKRSVERSDKVSSSASDEELAGVCRGHRLVELRSVERQRLVAVEDEEQPAVHLVDAAQERAGGLIQGCGGRLELLVRGLHDVADLIDEQ